MEEKKVLNIYEKMLAISNDLTTVAKNLEVGVGQSKYKATGEADVLAAIKPLEKQYGVYSYPFKREIIDTSVIETTSYKGEVKKSLFLRILTTYRFVNVENKDEYIDVISYGDGVDSQDKAPGKAMTYSDKYALMKAYKIITGDDPDQNPSEDLNSINKAKKGGNSEVSSFPQVNIEVREETSNINEKMTGEQTLIIFNLPDDLKAFACKKYGLESINQLTKAQAEYIITSLRMKGIIK